MVIVDFQIKNKASRPRFFQEIFLVADTKFEVILKMFFFKISNADVLFSKETFTWKTYTINEALPITKQVQIVNLEEFIITTLDVDNKIFVIHVAIREQEKMLVHSKKQA